MLGIGRSVAVLRQHAVSLLEAGIQEVQPNRLLPKWVKREGDMLLIRDQEPLKLKHNVYVVGFGKAVGGMAHSLQKILGSQLVKGSVSVPVGTRETMVKLNKPEYLPEDNGQFDIREGARNNLPDEAALAATKSIVAMISSLQESDILLVLISGGGSALLPLPLKPITLQEKLDTIKLLANSGAPIDALNCIRKRLSAVKGGRLLQYTKAKVFALIISDIVGDPLDLIASSPTVPNTDDPSLPLKILDKYNVTNKVPASVLTKLQQADEPQQRATTTACNLLIGTNLTAAQAACREAGKLGYHSHLLTTSLHGEARTVGKAMAELAMWLLSRQSDLNPSEIAEKLCVPVTELHLLSEFAGKAFGTGSPVCIITAGETTVCVTGSGTGGRNQEMALAAAMRWDETRCKASLMFLSAGTDGIDGPTDAAGGIAYPATAEVARRQGLDCSKFLHENDSYSFFQRLSGGEDHVKTGPTGTNVMDLQIMLLMPPTELSSNRICSSL
ncbi:glycerate kinase-like [Ornithodoros turicata]